MGPILLEAKPIVKQEKDKLSFQVHELKKKGIDPQLVVFIVGEDPASHIYVENKKKFIEEIGAKCKIIKLSENTTQTQLEVLVKESANDSSIHGILIQLPLPKHFEIKSLINHIPIKKDVDGFHPWNLGLLLENDLSGLRPCTPRGILKLIKYYQIPLVGRNTTVIGRGPTVGRPLLLELVHQNATVTICHSQSKNIPELCKKSDLIIVAVGKIKFFNDSFLSKNKKPFIIDVGIHREPESKKICGDVDRESILPYVQGISPVPGGIGPLTILSLAENLIIATKNQIKI